MLAGRAGLSGTWSEKSQEGKRTRGEGEGGGAGVRGFPDGQQLRGWATCAEGLTKGLTDEDEQF